MKKLASFIKTVPGIVTGIITVLSALYAIFLFCVTIATGPLVDRVDAIDEQQKTNIGNIKENSKLIEEIGEQSAIRDYRNTIIILTHNDAGKGDYKEFILFYYDELTRLCGECPATAKIIDEYLESLN